jgi:polyphosphate kinase 2
MPDPDTLSSKLPFDGAISRFYRERAPAALRRAIAETGKKDIIPAGYPYGERMAKEDYEVDLLGLQIELQKLQRWVKATGARVAVLFEGRDAAGKGGTIIRFRENLNPRVARVVALSKPSDRETGQWYFQRYVEELPSAGEIVLFDRSWYNRGVVEHVFGFCTPSERARFFTQLPGFESTLVDDGIYLFKIWLNVGQAEQLRRFLSRERDPLKQWKLSSIDVEGLALWDAYTSAIGETLARSHMPETPWTVIMSDDKRRARLEALRTVLSGIPYAGRNMEAVGLRDAAICAGPELWSG